MSASIENGIYRSAYLIANNIAIQDALPAEIGVGITLRRPDEIERRQIRELLQCSVGSSTAWWVPYEAIESRSEDGRMQLSKSDNPQDWHYYILSDDDGGRSVHQIAPTLTLLSPSLDLSIRVSRFIRSESPENTMFGYSPPMPHIIEKYHYMQIGSLSERKTVAISVLREADALRSRLGALDGKYTFVRNAVTIFHELRKVSDHSRLQVIGLFSIIESLVAHAPRLPESLDSISHQLSGKLQLVSNRFSESVCKPGKFNEVGAKKLWKMLYSYRSAIAHGSIPDFGKDFRSLGSNSDVFEYLFSFTRSLILFSIDDPQLFADLKEC